MQNKIYQLIYKLINVEYTILTLINESIISNRIYNFFTSYKFEPNKKYISLLFKINTVSRHHYTLSHRTAIDITNKEDINNYIKEVLASFNNLEDWYKQIIALKIIFNFTYISDIDYNRKVNKAKFETLDVFKDNTDIKPKELLNMDISKNTHYTTWGEYQIIENKKYFINNLYNIKNIQSIIIEQLDKFSKHFKITLIKSNNDIIVFEDTIIGNENFIRYFPKSNLRYYYKNENCYFYAEGNISFNDTITPLRKKTKNS